MRTRCETHARRSAGSTLGAILIAVTAQTSAQAQSSGAVRLDTISVEGEGSGRAEPGLDAYKTPGDAPGGLTRSVTSGGILGDKRVVDTPFSITGFTDKLIRDQQGQVATDILKNDASVTVQNTIGYFADQLYIRGFEVAISDRLYNGAQVGFLNKFALEGVQRIEILKGPSAILYGTGGFQGIGGVVNYVPKRALPFDYTSVTSSYIAPGYVGANVDISRRGGERNEFGIRFNGAFNSGGFYSGTHLRHELFQFNVDYAPSDRVRFYADYVHAANFNNRDQLQFSLMPGVPVPRAIRADRNYAQDWNYTYNPSELGYVKAEVDLSDDWMLSAHYRHSYFGNSYLAVLPSINDAAGNYSLLPFLIQKGYIQGDGGQANLRGRFATGVLGHEVNVGLDVENDALFGSAPVFGAPLASNIFNPVYYPNPGLQGGPASKSNDTLVTTSYGTDLITLPGGVVQLLAGARYVNIRSANFDSLFGNPVGEDTQAKTVPLAALLVHPTPDSLVYASYAQGFQRGSFAPANATVNANAALPPIPSEQFEVGAKAEFGGLIGTVAAFRIERSLEYLRVIDAITTQYVQDGLQRHDGIDASLSGEVVPGTRLIASVMALDPKAERTGSILTDGKVPIGVPRFQASLYGEQDLPWVRGLTLTGGLYYVGAQYVDLQNTQKIPEWARVDLGLRYRTLVAPGTLATVRLGVDNVADHRYYASAANGLGLGVPRTVKASVQLEW